MRRQGLQHRFHLTSQKPVFLCGIPFIGVSGAALAGGGQIIAQVIEVDKILPLRPKDLVHLLGNPERAIADAVDARVRIPADPPGTMGHLCSDLRRTARAGAEDRMDRPMLLNQN